MTEAASTAPVLVTHPRRARALRCLGLGLLTLVTMELAARVDDNVHYGAPITRNYDFDQLFHYDGKVVRGTPHASYMKWSLNGIGLRGPEPDPSEARPRVIVYGASEVFGIYETPGSEFPRQLEASLRERTKSDRPEVINAGIPGMRIGSGTEFLRALGERMKPAVVVVYPTPTHYIDVTQPHCGRAGPTQSQPVPIEWPASRLKAKTVDRLKEILPKPALDLARKGAIAWTTRTHPSVDHVTEASFKALEVDLQCAVQAVRAIGAQPVLVTHPNRFGATAQPGDAYLLTGWRMQYPVFTAAALLDIEQRANLVIRSVAAAEHVPLVDASVSLGGHGEYFADHAHFTDAGAKRMGQLLADAVEPLLKP